MFLRHGCGQAATLLGGLDAWAAAHGFRSVGEVRGRLAVPWRVDAAEHSRQGYVAALQQAGRTYRHA